MKLKTLFTIAACVLLPGCALFTKPNPQKIDTTGVMYHKWSKGWLVNTPSRQVAITSTHSNPSVGTQVSFTDNTGAKHERVIVNTFPVYLPIKENESIPVDFTGNLFNHFFAGDITVVVLDSPLPSTVKAYNPAYKTKHKSWVMLYNQEKQLIPAQIIVKENNIIGTTTTYQYGLKPGDSGLPWFNDKNEVVSHTITGEIGYGTVYGHESVRDDLGWFIQIAEDYTKILD